MEFYPDRIVVIDTETTGVNDKAEILQFSAIDENGKVLMNRYFRPAHTKKWPAAEQVNHITPEFAAKQERITGSAEEIYNLLKNANVIVGYNLPFDLGMLHRSGILLPEGRKYLDLMPPFAKRYGQYDPEHGTFKRQKLAAAAQFYNYLGTGFHDSLADVRATLYVYLRMVTEGSISKDDLFSVTVVK